MEKNNKIHQLIEELRKQGVELSEDQVKQLENELEKRFNYTPRIGIFGKTGAGKSSLINKIYGKDLCPVSDVDACTRKLQEANVGGVILIDCPGIAESAERDKEYQKMYDELIPTLDAILWVLKGDDRAYQPDLEFYNLIKDHFKLENGMKAPFFFVLNQVDKIEPFREWDVEAHKPGAKQAENIQKKVVYVARVFGCGDGIVKPVSAEEGYGLVGLVKDMLNSLEPEKAITVWETIEERRKKQEEIARQQGKKNDDWTVREPYNKELPKLIDQKKRGWMDRLMDATDLIFGPVFNPVRKTKEIWDALFG